MAEEKKWKLASGRYVEDVLFNFGLTRRFEQYVTEKTNISRALILLDHYSLAHSFVVDFDDEEIKVKFTSAELEEIEDHNAHPLPPCSEQLLEYLNEYSKLVIHHDFALKVHPLSNLISQTNIDDIVKRLRKRHYDFDEEFELEWAQYSIQSALRLFQGNFFPITDQTEADIIRRVWLFVDTAFDNTKVAVRT